MLKENDFLFRITWASVPMAGHCWFTSPQKTLKHSKVGLAQSLVGVTAPFPLPWGTQGFACAHQGSLVGMRFDFKCSCVPLATLLWLLLCPWLWGIFFLVGSNIRLSIVVQQLVAILVFSQKMSTRLIYIDVILMLATYQIAFFHLLSVILP